MKPFKNNDTKSLSYPYPNPISEKISPMFGQKHSNFLKKISGVIVKAIVRGNCWTTTFQYIKKGLVLHYQKSLNI